MCIATLSKMPPQVNPAWWATGLANQANVNDKLAELAEKHQGMDAWNEVAKAVAFELQTAVQQLKAKQADRFLEDDQRELRSGLDAVKQQLTQGERFGCALRLCVCACACGGLRQSDSG
jgi:hypothetical protein